MGIKRTFEKEIFKCNFKGVVHPALKDEVFRPFKPPFSITNN